jgi:hypothetical protein
MKVTKASKKAQDLLNELARSGNMVDVYSRSFFDRQPNVKDEPNAPFNQEGYQYILDDYENNLDSDEKPVGHLLLINFDGLNDHLKKALIELYEPLVKLIDDGKHNPDFLMINIYTKQILCDGLGRKNRLFAIDATTGKTINAFNLLGGPYTAEDIDYIDRFTQHDVYECVSDLVHALYSLGLAMYNYDSAPEKDALENSLKSGPDNFGIYYLKDITGEILDDEYSKEEIIELLDQMVESEIEGVNSMRLINVFFPECCQGDLNTGNY